MSEETPSYFFCSKKDIPYLVEQANAEANNMMKELSMFYTGDIGITIKPVDHANCYSIGATLTVNGEPVKSEDTCDLIFLELNELMLKRMIDAGLPRRPEVAYR